MLEVKDVSVVLDGKKILKRVNYRLKRKEINLIVGPNGSGKSTLFKSIMGIVPISEGLIKLDGRDITSKRPHERFKLGVVLAPEGLRVAQNLTVKENIEIGGKIEEYIFEIFPELKMLLNKNTKNLSGGERQMVVLARAFLSNPKYLLLDEPFHGLYQDVRDKLIKKIEEFSENVGIAVITHDEIEKVLSISDNVCVMIGGEIVFFGSSSEADRVLRRYMFI